MKQRKLIRKVYRACLEHDQESLHDLRLEEFRKIFKHRAEGKSFSAKWIVAQI